MAIGFSCACGVSMSVPETLAGKTGKCPACEAVLAVPSPAVRVALAPADDVAPSLRFRCPGCRKTLRVALRLAGQNGKCSECGATFRCPVPPPRGARRSGEPLAATLREAFAVSKVRCACGVMSGRARGTEAACPACGEILPGDGG